MVARRGGSQDPSENLPERSTGGRLALLHATAPVVAREGIGAFCFSDASLEIWRAGGRHIPLGFPGSTNNGEPRGAYVSSLSECQEGGTPNV